VIGIDPEYFLDNMSQDELSAIYKSKSEAEKMTWEQTRLICFWNVVATNGTKKFKKPSDLFPFTWDKVKSKDAKKLTK
jgi:hypothetical protein